MGELRHNSFKIMMNDVVDFGSCCECGSCVAACPHNVIEMVEGKPKQTAKASAPFDFVESVRVRAVMYVRLYALGYGPEKLI